MSARVFLGLSGGVDSALSAALLAEQGYDVTCIYMRNWSRDLPGFACPWADELADAERVAVALGLPLEVWDCEREYKETVVDYLVDAYARGFTPNPDVMCNQTVKFGTFAEKAFAAGADLIATGHYASVEHRPDGPAILSRAADEHKDQTYFLWRVRGEVLNRALFPMAEIPSKAVAREMCRARRISVADKPDSDGICFIGPVGLRTFLLDSLDRRAGDIVDWETGAVLGRHDGAFLFTVGQRKGLDLGGGPARYVVGTSPVPRSGPARMRSRMRTGLQASLRCRENTSFARAIRGRCAPRMSRRSGMDACSSDGPSRCARWRRANQPSSTMGAPASAAASSPRIGELPENLKKPFYTAAVFEYSCIRST